MELKLKEEIVDLVEHAEKRHESLKDATVFVKVTVTDNCHEKPIEVIYEVSAVYTNPTAEPKMWCRLSNCMETQDDVIRALREGYVAYDEEETAKEVPA